MKTRKTRADRRFTRLLIATMILSVLALITMVVAFSSDSFHFQNHKPTNEMPDLIGLTEKEAIDAIKAAGGNAAVSYAHNSVQKGVVIEQGVKKGDHITHNQTVSIKVSLGPEAAPSAQEDWNTVPNFSGLTVENAEKTAEKLELKIVVGEYVFDEEVRYGSICQQSPAAGISVPPGTEVHVNLSKGPQIVRYTITITCGAGGTVSPSGTVTVEQGKSTSFAIIPDDGYEIESMMVDGEPVTPSVYYQFSDVNKNHTLSVTFKESGGGIIIF